MTLKSFRWPYNTSAKKESSTSSATQHSKHGSLDSRKPSSRNYDTYNPLIILEAKTASTVPDRACIKWPPPKKPRYPTIIRRRYKTIPLRDQIHIQVAKEAGLNLKKCSICGIERIHGNFHVHHINGDHNDNRPENLIVVCRDCHINLEHGYTTPSFASETDGVYGEADEILEDE